MRTQVSLRRRDLARNDAGRYVLPRAEPAGGCAQLESQSCGDRLADVTRLGALDEGGKP